MFCFQNVFQCQLLTSFFSRCSIWWWEKNVSPPYSTGNSFELQSGLLVEKYYIVCVVIASRVGGWYEVRGGWDQWIGWHSLLIVFPPQIIHCSFTWASDMLPRARLAVERNTSTLTLTPVSLPGRSNISRLVRYCSRKQELPSESILNVCVVNCWQNQWESPVKSSARCKVHWKCKWDFYVAILSFAIGIVSQIYMQILSFHYTGERKLIILHKQIRLVGHDWHRHASSMVELHIY
jgi:hypothetical protein